MQSSGLAYGKPLTLCVRQHNLRLPTALALAASFTCVSCAPVREQVAPPAPKSVGSAASAAAPRPSSSTVTYAGGNGSSLEQAITVLGATNSFVGIRAEYAWLNANFPGYKRKSQALLHNAGKSYDLLEVELPNGQTARFYFDISAFFGKF